MKIHSLICAGLFILPLSITANAQDLCGGYLEKGSKNAKLLDGHGRTTINCYISTTKKDCHIAFPSELRKGSYLGDTLRLNRKSIKEPWVIRIQGGGSSEPLKSDIDISKDISIAINDNDPLVIPAKFISRNSYKYLTGRAYFDTKFSKAIVEQLKTAKAAKITATDGAGNPFTSVFNEREFENVKTLFDWADCMQKQNK